MPLDRPIVVGIRGMDDYNDAGQFVPGAVTQYTAGATPVEISTLRNLDGPARGGGARLQADRFFRVRWFPELAVAPPTSVSVTDELGLSYTVTRIEEFVGRYGDVRHRWLDLDCTREAQTRL